MLISGVVSSSPQKTQFESGTQKVSLLELYTSEGCSSCPPAEKWTSRLKNDPDLWRKFIPVVFHVDYWDYLGWKDPYSSKENTQRQRRYSTEWGARTIYTPGFVLNGKEWRRWGGRFQNKLTEDVGTLKASVSSERDISIQFFPTESVDDPIANVAILGFDIVTSVKAGENRGENLGHEFSVLAWKQVKLQKMGKFLTAKTNIKSALPDLKQYGVAVWVEANGSQIPIQATGGFVDF